MVPGFVSIGFKFVMNRTMRMMAGMETPQTGTIRKSDDNHDTNRSRDDAGKEEYDVIVIGGGPAGYTAGIYCSRGGYDTLILSGVLPGGQLMNTTEVENYPGFKSGIMGPDLMMEMRDQCSSMGTTIIDDEVSDVDFRRKPFRVLTGSSEYQARAVIIATGATPRRLGLEGEQTFGGRGVSYCATCDGPFFRNQPIVVVGGGDSAVEESTFLTKFGSEVHLVHRRGELRASKAMQDRVFGDKKMIFHWDTTVTEIRGDQRMRQIVLKNVKTDKEEVLDAGGLFVAIGHVPNTELFKGQIELDAKGYVALKDGRQHTSVKGVFAAGDVHDSTYRQAVTAAGFGCMAALDVNEYLTGLAAGEK